MISQEDQENIKDFAASISIADFLECLDQLLTEEIDQRRIKSKDTTEMEHQRSVIREAIRKI